jgi:hypothetical protein
MARLQFWRLNFNFRKMCNWRCIHICSYCWIWNYGLETLN